MKLKILRQVLLMSKYGFLGICLQALFCSLLLAKETNAQKVSMEEIYITANLKDATIKDAFDLISLKTPFKFAYELTNADLKEKVDLQRLNSNYHKETLANLLRDISKTSNLKFKRINNNIFVSAKEAFADPIEEIISLNSFQVKGVVTSSDDGEPLPGVSILIKGTQTGTTTNLNGEYTLDVNEGDILLFSFIGYQTQEATIGSKTTLNIALEFDQEQLEEVIVIGYGTVKKSDLTGSVSALKSEDLNPGANASVDQMMQGRAAGVQISQSSSEPGGGLSIRIRGSSSINAGNEPLYVIDGFPIDNSSNLSGSGLSSDPNNVGAAQAIGSNLSPKNPLNSLNPNDIESIEILKDASATAIYGSRGANGVVLITTKKGSNDKLTVSYNTYFGTQSVAKQIDVMDAEQYMNFINDISADRGNSEVFSTSDISTIGSGTTWQDEIYRSAPISDNNVSLSGGVGNSKIYASIDYFNQKGILKNTGIKKYIGRLNLDSKLGENTNIGFNINTSHIADQNGIDGVNTNESAGPIYTSLLYDPTEPIFNADGSYAVSENLTINNPMSLIDGVKSKSQTDRTLANFYVSYKIIDGLIAKLNLGSDISNVKRDVFVSTLTNRGEALGGYADVTSSRRSSILGEYTMNYSKEINENHRFDVLGGVTYQKFYFSVFNANINGFPTDDIETNNLSLGDTNTDNLYSNKEDNTLFSYLGRINYTLFDKFLLTGSIRADGSSRFGDNNKYGYFPSFAFGYKMSEEAFVPDFFEELKFRASWGQTGNQEISNYASQLTFGTGSFVVFDGQIQGSTNPLRIANPDLKWETTTQFNVGLDASMLSGRINVTLDYFSKSTTDLLFNLALPQSSGYSSILTNVGEVSNKGVEILINSTNISTKDFSWNTSLNFTSIKNEVVDLGRIDQITTGYLQVVGGNSAIIKEGSPLASYYGYEITGIQQEGDEIPGYPKFKDQNGDDQITTADQTIVGDPFPDFTYGINNQFEYKNWGLSFFFQGMEGGDLFNVMAAESMYPANDRRNRMTMMMDRWTPTNTDAAWPSATNPNSYPAGSAGKVNSLTIMDASYFRLKNVQISYNVPTQNISFLSTLRLYATGQNLFTITDYPGYDPEANAFGRNNVKVDYASYPLARTFMVGLNATF
ncbi:SusC/RagA family TonB-linked outer membrane protein [Chondrinema litorale]|uniref:SusC/RagA family TonB-linked outer membrane protein n=1 Tax=Chondrinema litorale TaxID=2994555 RepID=UPI0025426B8D|nr:TonB-dependent receptor [Chondrinema litorale]UZR96266.1 TonB-dependent receptor [Chondrinema litorale]